MKVLLKKKVCDSVNNAELTGKAETGFSKKIKRRRLAEAVSKRYLSLDIF